MSNNIIVNILFVIKLITRRKTYMYRGFLPNATFGPGKKLHNGKFHIGICLMRYLGYLFRNSLPCEYIPKFFRPKMKTKQPTLHYYPSSD